MRGFILRLMEPLAYFLDNDLRRLLTVEGLWEFPPLVNFAPKVVQALFLELPSKAWR